MNFKSIAQLFDLKGKSAIVTGGAAGIGQAIALRLAEAGAAVMIADIDFEAAKQTARDIEAKGGRAQAVRTDVSSTSDAQQAVLASVKAFGGLDILVNNAGIYPRIPALEISEEIWDRVLDINLKGAFFCSQAAARQMIAAGGGGKIINMASLVCVHPWLCMTHYAASKAGLHMLTQSLALELAPHNILVNTVAPGIVVTPGTLAQAVSLLNEKPAGSEKPDNALARIAMGRIGEPDDIARVVLFLASSATDYMTGSLIMADGGYELT
jgi:2-deoxy-D-gluconate 3-dehydrogenase